MNKYLLDTNVLLRFLLDDHAELSRAAAGLFQQAADGECLLLLTDLGIAEAVWVLTSFYKLERQRVAESLAKMIVKAGIQCPTLEPTLDALARFKASNCDFFDCYLAAQAAASGVAVASFDKDLKKFEDVSLWEGERL
ncbi:MAG TPA: PIN domain-containing protein [Terrimicrobiaceae bacterium]